jgi:hypothetical protein
MIATIVTGVVVTHVLALVVGFVAGVLFGRRNPNKVEATVDKVQDVAHKL